MLTPELEADARSLFESSKEYGVDASIPEKLSPARFIKLYDEKNYELAAPLGLGLLISNRWRELPSDRIQHIPVALNAIRAHSLTEAACLYLIERVELLTVITAINCTLVSSQIASHQYVKALCMKMKQVSISAAEKRRLMSEIESASDIMARIWSKTPGLKAIAKTRKGNAIYTCEYIRHREALAVLAKPESIRTQLQSVCQRFSKLAPEFNLETITEQMNSLILNGSESELRFFKPERLLGHAHAA